MLLQMGNTNMIDFLHEQVFKWSLLARYLEDLNFSRQACSMNLFVKRMSSRCIIGQVSQVVKLFMLTMSLNGASSNSSWILQIIDKLYISVHLEYFPSAMGRFCKCFLRVKVILWDSSLSIIYNFHVFIDGIIGMYPNWMQMNSFQTFARSILRRLKRWSLMLFISYNIFKF